MKKAFQSSSSNKSENRFNKGKKVNFKKKKEVKQEEDAIKTDGLIRLNRFIANAGICSRREADQLIASGVVEINSKVITELGTKVSANDQVKCEGKLLNKEIKKYLLLNKPKDFITTMDDPKGRRTVLDLVKRACIERIYPVGRLDRATTGLLLFTNDGEMTKKLTHPSSNIKKVYRVGLDKVVTQKDLFKLVEGIQLEDGLATVDKASYALDADDKKVVQLELHSGKNRIIRRMMEALGYKVTRLDRIQFAGLTKKDIPRGRFRFLSEKEVGFLHRIAGIKQHT